MAGRKEAEDIAKACHFEHLWLPQVNFTPESCYGPVGTHDDRPFWQSVTVLQDTIKVSPRRVCLTRGAASKIHNVVSVIYDVREELGDTLMSPVTPDHVQHVAQSIGSA